MLLFGLRIERILRQHIVDGRCWFMSRNAFDARLLFYRASFSPVCLGDDGPRKRTVENGSEEPRRNKSKTVEGQRRIGTMTPAETSG